MSLKEEEAEEPAGPESAELRRNLLSAALLWAQRWREARRYEPGMSADERGTLLAEWQMAMDVTKSNRLGREDPSA